MINYLENFKVKNSLKYRKVSFSRSRLHHLKTPHKKEEAKTIFGILKKLGRDYGVFCSTLKKSK